MKRTQQQTEAISAREEHLVVDAGAGSGKTRVLIERMVDLLDKGEAALDEIVAITFTEKAAAEMKARLRQAFRARAPKGDSEEMTRWRGFERRLDMARISTIHAFCGRLLRENALRLGLDPDFAVMDEADSVLQVEQVVTETLHALLEAKDEAAVRLAMELRLSDIVQILKPLLRKRLLMERIGAAYPMSDPEALLAHWGRLVAEERGRRLRALRCSNRLKTFQNKLRRFDGCCTNAEDVRERWRLEAIDGIGRILGGASDQETEAILERTRQTRGRSSGENWESRDSWKSLTDLQKKVKEYIKRILDSESLGSDLEARAARMTCDLYATYREVDVAYRAFKAANNCLDFDDLIAGAREALRDHAALRTQAAQRIKFLLVDEFQDTDGYQLELAHLLCEGDEAPDLFVVGDAKQSIYYFRGAEVEIFETERQACTRVLRLDKNFRTLPDVLCFVNDFFLDSGLLAAVEDYTPMAAHREARNEVRVEFLLADPPEDLGNGKWLVEEARRAEAALIAERIRELCDGEEAPPASNDAGGYRSPSFGDVALLFRSMSNVHLYEEALRRAGIPYTLVAGAGFYKRQEVVDFLNLLRVAIEPCDEPALLAFLRGPIAGLSDASILRLCRAGTLVRLFEGTDADGESPLSDFPEEATRLDRAQDLIAGLRTRREMPVSAFLRYALDVTGLEAIVLGQYMGVQKASNVRKLVALSEEFTSGRPSSLRTFVRYLDEVGEHAVREGEAPLQPEGTGAVTLMTVHKSKGLEFPVVFVPDMSQAGGKQGNEQLILHRELGMALKVAGDDGAPVTPAIGNAIRTRTRDEERAEHARLLYVAMTRARDRLVLCGTSKLSSESWLEAFDVAYGIADAQDGAEIGGTGWRARIRRRSGTAPRKRVSGVSEPTPALEQLLRRVGAVPETRGVRRMFSISAILDHKAGGFDEHQEWDADDMPAFSDASRSWKLARGSLVHRMFEVWDFRGATGPPIEALVREAGLGLRNREKLVKDLEQIAARFAALPLGKRVATEKSIQRETPFYLNVGDAIVSGKIDVLLGDGTIVDYKTGNYDPEGHERYEWQLLLYAAAVHALRGCEPEKGYLYYVDAGEEYEVALTSDRIEEARGHAREVISQMASSSTLTS